MRIVTATTVVVARTHAASDYVIVLYFRFRVLLRHGRCVLFFLSYILTTTTAARVFLSTRYIIYIVSAAHAFNRGPGFVHTSACTGVSAYVHSRGIVVNVSNAYGFREHYVHRLNQSTYVKNKRMLCREKMYTESDPTD